MNDNDKNFEKLEELISEKRVTYIVGCERIADLCTFAAEYRNNGETIAFVARDKNGEIILSEEFKRTDRIAFTTPDDSDELNEGEIAIEVARDGKDRTYAFALGVILSA